ncbi:hypothetical protein GW17_00054729 [Ensete ventricosum]|nr:hypothetical protein GW17_00054729 [Ensete ventricosum]
MVLPGVVGFKLTGKLRNGVTATDLVLTVTQILRKHGVVGKFVAMIESYLRANKMFVDYSQVIFFNSIGVLLPDIVAAAVLSGNRNFEGRVHPLTRANYLASPPLVVAYSLAGTVFILTSICHLLVDIDFEKEPIGTSKDGKKVYFKDIWPSNEEIANVQYPVLAHFH